LFFRRLGHRWALHAKVRADARGKRSIMIDLVCGGMRGSRSVKGFMGFAKGLHQA
jgi:hypothetical protein